MALRRVKVDDKQERKRAKEKERERDRALIRMTTEKSIKRRATAEIFPIWLDYYQ